MSAHVPHVCPLSPMHLAYALAAVYRPILEMIYQCRRSCVGCIVSLPKQPVGGPKSSDLTVEFRRITTIVHPPIHAITGELDIAIRKERLIFWRRVQRALVNLPRLRNLVGRFIYTVCSYS